MDFLRWLRDINFNVGKCIRDKKINQGTCSWVNGAENEELIINIFSEEIYK